MILLFGTAADAAFRKYKLVGVRTACAPRLNFVRFKFIKDELKDSGLYEKYIRVYGFFAKAAFPQRFLESQENQNCQM